MNYARVIDVHLRALARQQEKQAAYVESPRWYDFLIAPSCPPDKRLHIRGGYATESYNFGGVVVQATTPAMICDFENEAETDMGLVFINANYYLPIILCYYGEWIAFRTLDPDLYTQVFDNVTGTEVATAVEAEAQIDAWMNGYTEWSYYRFPLRGVVLRNTGATGISYEIMPIDAVNRGRSYLYRDPRSWNRLGS